MQDLDAMESGLKDAIAYLQSNQGPAPAKDRIAAALLTVEKQAKREKMRYRYDQLLGTWRLGFITGTIKTRQKSGVAMGAGRFIPRLLKIQLTYEATDLDSGLGTVK
ncbi:MAG: hypothetical protein AAGC54_09290, partial [Cyanobacteria bacterium P01_F01_bin.4]